MSRNNNIDKTLDVKGLKCPAPTVMTERALREIDKGRTLEVISTDITTKQSIPEICSREGYDLLELEEKDGVLNFIIRKK